MKLDLSEHKERIWLNPVWDPQCGKMRGKTVQGSAVELQLGDLLLWENRFVDNRSRNQPLQLELQRIQKDKRGELEEVVVLNFGFGHAAWEELDADREPTTDAKVYKVFMWRGGREYIQTDSEQCDAEIGQERMPMPKRTPGEKPGPLPKSMPAPGVTRQEKPAPAPVPASRAAEKPATPPEPAEDTFWTFLEQRADGYKWHGNKTYGLAISNDGSSWAVTHALSGILVIDRLKSERIARRIVAFLIDYSGVSWALQAPTIDDADALQAQVHAIARQDLKPFAGYVEGAPRARGCSVWVTSYRHLGTWEGSAQTGFKLQKDSMVTLKPKGKGRERTWEAGTGFGRLELPKGKVKLSDLKAFVWQSYFTRLFPDVRWAQGYGVVSLSWREHKTNVYEAALHHYRLQAEQSGKEWAWRVLTSGSKLYAGTAKGRASAMAAATKAVLEGP